MTTRVKPALKWLCCKILHFVCLFHVLLFLISMSIIRILFCLSMSIIFLCNESCSAGWLAVLHGKNFNVGHYTQTIQPNVFIPAIPIGTVDFYQFIPLSLILTLNGGHKDQRKETPLGFIFSHTFHLIRINFDVVMPAKRLCDASSVLVGVELPISSRFQPSPLASKLLAASRKGEHCASVSPCQYIAYPQQVLCSAFSWRQVLLGTVRPQH